MNESDVDGPRQTLDEAIKVMRKVFQDATFQDEHRNAINLISSEEIEQLVELSWRFQFDKERSRLRKGLQAMFEHATQRQGAKEVS